MHFFSSGTLPDGRVPDKRGFSLCAVWCCHVGVCGMSCVARLCYVCMLQTHVHVPADVPLHFYQPSSVSKYIFNVCFFIFIAILGFSIILEPSERMHMQLVGFILKTEGNQLNHKNVRIS